MFFYFVTNLKNQKLFLQMIFSLILLSIFFNGCNKSINPEFKEITAKQAYTLIQQNQNNSNFVILDIRTKKEFNEGHIKNSILIDYYLPTFKTELNKLDKNKIYLVYCRTGNRSSHAMKTFSLLGFKNIYDMNDGIAGWKKAKFAVYKKP